MGVIGLEVRSTRLLSVRVRVFEGFYSSVMMYLNLLKRISVDSLI